MTDFFLHYVHHKDLTVGLGDGKELKEKVIWWDPACHRGGKVRLW